MNQTENKPRKRQYDEAFRRNAVALMESSERSLQEIATELGVSHWNLRDWRKSYGSKSSKASKAATPEEMRREMAALRKENQSLANRCEILKKALGILVEPCGKDMSR